MSDFHIVDSHVHFWPGQEVDWTKGTPLHSQHSVDEYLTATGECQPPHHPGIRGFVLVKADRKCGRKINDILTTGYDELEWIARVIQDMPKPREGDGEGRPSLCLGVIP